MLTLFIIVLAAASISYFSYITTLSVFKEEITDKMEEQASSAMDKIDRMLFERMVDIKTIAEDPAIASGVSTPKQITECLIGYRNKYKAYASLSFFNLDRVRIADTAGLDLGIKRKRIGQHWEDVFSDKVSVATDIAISETLHIPVIFFAALVKNPAGEKIGVVVSRIPVEVLYEITEQAAGTHLKEVKERVDLINEDGLLLYSNYNRKGILTQNLKDSELFKIVSAEMAQKRGVFVSGQLESKEGEFYVFVVEQGYLDFKGNGWVLLVNVPSQAVFSPITKLKSRILFILLPVIFVSLMIILLFSRSVSSSLIRLRDAAFAVGMGNVDVDISVESKDEIGDLASAFRKMVSDLKESSRRLLNEKAYTESIISSTVDNLVVIDLNCRIKIVNRELLNLLGYREDELIGEPAEKIFSGMGEAEAEAENILNEIDVGALLISKDLRVLAVNRAMLEMTGLEKKDFLNQMCYKVMHGRESVCEPGYIACPISEEGEGNKPCVEVHEHIDKEGKPVLVTVTAASVVDSHGETVYYLHLARKLTVFEKGMAVQETDVAVARSLVDKLRQFIERLVQTHIFCAFGIRRIISLGLVRDVEMELMAKNGERIKVNFSASPIFDPSIEGTPDISGSKNIIGVVGIARDMRQTKQLITELEISKSMLQELSATLEQRVNARTKELERSQEATLNILADLTEAKDKVTKYSKELEEALSVKSKFTSMVSHELRTPLTAIKEGIGIVLDGSAGNLNSEQKEFLDIAKRNVERLARLINSVLDFQKLEAGRVEFNMQDNDINKVAIDVKQTMASLMKEKGIDFNVILDESLLKVKFDRDRITQVLMNMADNAFKFTDKGAITITTSRREGSICVCVADTGIGIRQEDMHRLFRSFEQITKDREVKRPGSGLGLAISKGIIERHNGTVWAESEFGKGSAFYFTLPIA